MHSYNIITLLSLSTLGASHMIMKNPVPFEATKHASDNGPLKPDGSNFPCKFGYDTEGASNTMPLGSKQELAFVGGATHGGGSCQVSITYDSAPTADSKFKVIHSIMGGCPARNVAGNIGTSATSEDPDTYEFSIPETLPPGNAVLAWTWFNKVGNREMYMNCAPVTLTGATAKRSSTNETEIMKRGMEAFDALPDMFVANIGNGCTTKDNSDLKFENPGKSVDIISSTSLSGPVGNCAKAANTAASKTDPSDASTPAAGAFFTASPDPKSDPQPESEPVPSPKPVPASTPKIEEPPKAATDDSDYETPSPKPLPEEPLQDSPNSNTNSSKPSEALVPADSGNIKVGDSCSTEGAWNCIGGNSYQRCASGKWSVTMDLADGTSCTAGKSESIKIVPVERSSIRIPRSHLRRHINGAKFR